METNMDLLCYQQPICKDRSCRKRFLRELDINTDHALLIFNFDSSQFRRIIDMPELIRKRILDKYHRIHDILLIRLRFRFAKLKRRDHDKQLYGHNGEITFCQEQ